MTITPEEELKRLNEKRTALERAVRIALSLERMYHGLQTAAYMGRPSASIPKKMLATIDEMDDVIKIMPSQRLFESLHKLEKAVTAKFALIMQMAELDESQLLEKTADDAGNIETILTEYRKKAQTAIALKILLHNRGEITKPLKLPVSAEDIKIRLKELGAREKKCRLAIRDEIIEIIDESIRILKRDDLPDEMKLLLTRRIYRDDIMLA